MADSDTHNQRLKAIILDARMAFHQKALAVKENLQLGEEEAADLTREAEEVLALFDRPETWIGPIEYDSRELFRCIDQFQRSDEEDLESFSESLAVFVGAFRQLIAPPARARSALGSPFNGLMEEALLNNRRTVDGIEAMYLENGQNLHQIEEYAETASRQSMLVNHYTRKLQSGEHQATALQVKRIKDWNGFFQEVTAETPVEDFILDCQDYNDELQHQCPLPAP